MGKTLEELAVEERRAYYREWYANHRDQVKAGNAEYWKRRAKKKQEADAIAEK